MNTQAADLTVTAGRIAQYAAHLREQERAGSTVRRYVHDLGELMVFLAGRPATKEGVIAWKEHLTNTYAPATVNTMLAAVNGFFRFMDRRELSVRPLRVQRALFCREDRELTRAEYVRLIKAAGQMGEERLPLILQTICATGIRVSELQFITAEAVAAGRAEVCSKGKRRVVFLPGKLCALLREYLKKKKITAGAVFVTRTGRPVDRSNIWRAMKALCARAEVEPDKVFPHNLRHLFARTYYTMEKDLSRLADILGHSNVNTTRIYTAESGAVHARQLDRMALAFTTEGKLCCKGQGAAEERSGRGGDRPGAGAAGGQFSCHPAAGTVKPIEKWEERYEIILFVWKESGHLAPRG